MMSSKFGFRSGKCNHDWHQLSSLITGWICWTFHDIGWPSDLNERLANTIYEAKRFTQKQFASPDIFCHLLNDC